MTRTMTALGILISTAALPVLAQRFDNVVRADFFAGFRGDAARLAHAMDVCEKTLAGDPKNAAALVWHGGGLFYQSGLRFRAGDTRAGVDLQQRGLKEMDDAVALGPDDLQTLIPRGAVLLAGAPFFPDEAGARPLLQKAVGAGGWFRSRSRRSTGSRRRAIMHVFTQRAAAIWSREG